MKALRSLIIVILFSALAIPVYAAGKLLVVDRGMDGGTRLYNIYCPDGSRGQVQRIYDMHLDLEPKTITGPDGTVMHVDKTATVKYKETCAAKDKGKQTCRSDWTVDEAAKEICQ